LDRYDLLIMEKNTFGKEEYKLSLLGVLFVLTLIRWNNLGKLPNGLYHSQLSFSEYADKIVGSYKKKLPLVFENWSILRDYLEIYAIYHLDVILDKDLRQKYIRRSVISEGIGEYHDLAKAMASRAQYQMSVLLMDGLQTCLNFTERIAIRNSLDRSELPESRKLVKLKTDVVYDAIQKMTLHVKPFIQTDELDESIKRYLMEVREDILSTEIAFFYYFFMFRNDHFRFSAPSKPREHNMDIDDVLRRFTCKYYVPNVVHAPMVKEFLSSIIKDISTHQEIVKKELGSLVL
jgi:hypothetical protein